eukprot:TRINITY_DN746_c0_g1_i25.p1 TRINITY_DN746_c0_g1~~TRINITY_DN746_c0_g1_i25.p1  ORF type:complete len:263 (-),score=1.36 TRINITY_DN746_c0_g1_i25:534-1277(-)
MSYCPNVTDRTVSQFTRLICLTSLDVSGARISSSVARKLRGLNKTVYWKSMKTEENTLAPPPAPDAVPVRRSSSPFYVFLLVISTNFFKRKKNKELTRMNNLVLKLVNKLLQHTPVSGVKVFNNTFNKVALPRSYFKKFLRVNVEDLKIKNEFRAELLQPENTDLVNGVVIYIHGGAFITGSPEMYRYLTARVASLSNIPVVVPDYRLSVDHPYPAQIIDCLRTLSYIQEKYNPKHIFLGGDSAGKF